MNLELTKEEAEFLRDLLGANAGRNPSYSIYNKLAELVGDNNFDSSDLFIHSDVRVGNKDPYFRVDWRVDNPYDRSD